MTITVLNTDQGMHAALDAAEEDRADKVVSGLKVTGMQNFGAWVLGDAAATRFGAAPVGLPTGVGYAVGNRLVHAYLAATGTNVTDALHTASEEIIAVALDRR